MHKSPVKRKVLNPKKSFESNVIGELLIPIQWKEAMGVLKNFNSDRNNSCIENIIDELNNLRYPISNMNLEFCIDVILELSNHLFIDSNQELVISKFCQLVSTICVKQELSFSVDKGTKLTLFFANLISKSETWLLVDALRTLSYILYDMASKYSVDTHKVVLANILPLIKVSISDLEVRRQAMNCFVNICGGNPEMIEPYSKVMYTTLMGNFDTLCKAIEGDSSLQKLLFSVLKVLICVITVGDKIHLQDTEKLVTQLTKLMFYGTKFFPVSNYCSITKKESSFTSDSDMSDSDSSITNRDAVKIRLQSLQLISTMAKKDFKSLFGEWKLILADNDSLNPIPKYKQSISTVLLYDSSSRVRLAAVQTLGTMLENSSLYLAQASDALTKSAFTSFSQTLASMIKELHFTLISSIKNDTLPVLPQSIRTLSILIENTPYTKFNWKILPQIGELLIDMILSNKVEKTVQNQAFICLSSLFGTKDPLPDVALFIRNDKIDILTKLIKFLSPDYIHVIRVEASHVLSSIAKNYPDFLWDYWNEIIKHIKSGLSHNEITLRQALVQIINNFTTPFIETKIIVLSTKKPLELFNLKVIDEEKWKDIFEILLMGINDVHQSIRSLSVSIFANILPSTFDNFSKEFASKVIKLVFDASNDENATVRISACRTVGVFVLFSSLQKDDKFIKQTVEILDKLMVDKVLNVRIRASWSLANVCDSLRVLPRNTSDDIVKSILIPIISSCTDNDKIVCNSVRALGNISNFASNDLLSSELFKAKPCYTFDLNYSNTIPLKTVEKVLIETFLQTLSSDKMSVKTKWNTCYAIGNLLANSNISEESTNTAIDCLCERMCVDTNFKVRIQAALALSLTNSYGKNSFKVLKSLFKAYSDMNSDSPSQYSEYKYIVTLKSQLISTVIHFIEVVDLVSLVNDEKVREYFLNVGVSTLVSIFIENTYQDQFVNAVKILIPIFKEIGVDEKIVDRLEKYFSQFNDI
ncbi:hypothetical protein ABK040_003640 [Willaertia magna]